MRLSTEDNFELSEENPMTINEYQNSVYQEIKLRAQSYNIIYVYGAIGSGKTSIMEKFRDVPSFIFPFSDINKKDESLFPWITSSKASANQVANINDATDAILSFDQTKCFKEPVKFLFSVFNKSLRTARELNNIFNDKEITVILNLIKLTAKGNYYLIFDNCENMNESSLQFINKLLTTCYINKLLKDKLKIILIENTNLISDSFNIVAETKIKVEIDNTVFEDFIDISSGSHTFSHDDKILLATVTGKDLGLVKVLLNYYKENNIEHDILIQSSTGEMLSDIFNKMIAIHLQERGKELDCLEIASVLGLIVNAYDLSELTHDEIGLVRDALEFGESLGLIASDTPDYSLVRFLHPIVKDILYSKLRNKEIFHREYSIILKKKYPTKHMIITDNLHRSAQRDIDVLYEFCTNLVMLALQNKLSAFDFGNNSNKYVSSKYKTFADVLYRILLWYEQGEYEICLKNINRICLIDIPGDYCNGIIKFITARVQLIIGNTLETFHEVKNLLLKAASVFLDYEMYDIYFDALTVLLNVCAYKLSDMNGAREIEKQYVEIYNKILPDVDDSELYNSYIEFKRRTASLLDAQGAFERMSDILSRDVFEDFLPKYKAYSDMIGYSLYAGEFSTAQEYSEQIRQYVNTNSFYVFPEEYKYINNAILSDIFCSEVGTGNFFTLVKCGIEQLKKYEDQPGVSKVVKTNLACLYMLNMNFEEAETRLFKLYNTLDEYSNSLYYTVVPSNLAALYAIKGDFKNAEKFNREVKSHLYMWDDNYQIYYKHQNEYMLKLIQQQSSITPLDLFRPDESARISAKTYQFVGRGIMMSELLFYTL